MSFIADLGLRISDFNPQSEIRNSQFDSTSDGHRMNAWWPALALFLLVLALLVASRVRRFQSVFRWLPVPLWCYLLPALGVHLGWLPGERAGGSLYRALTNALLPVALAVLLLGVDVPSVLRTGRRALIAAATGAVGVILGTSLGVCVAQAHLPPEAWKGAGALAGTWTGGTMNLLALQALLEIPHAIFAPLVLVDALVAYSWMTLLVAASGFQRPIDRWLRAEEPPHAVDPLATTSILEKPSSARPPRRWRPLILCATVALAVAFSARWMAGRLPTSPWISSASGWTVWLVTTTALSLSLIPSLRRAATHAGSLGVALLYLVLAATGAQASVQALQSTPAWVVVGIVVVLLHGGLLLFIGRCCRLPLGILATASQANIGGVISAPLVGAVYHPSLAPTGVLLAIAGNALGTYVGVVTAQLCRWLLRA